jgi:hypothetical protein
MMTPFPVPLQVKGKLFDIPAGDKRHHDQNRGQNQRWLRPSSSGIKRTCRSAVPGEHTAGVLQRLAARLIFF